MSELSCPVCGEQDFDAAGLRRHFVNGLCEPAEEAERLEQARFQEWLEQRRQQRAAQWDRSPEGGNTEGGSVHESPVPEGDAP